MAQASAADKEAVTRISLGTKYTRFIHRAEGLPNVECCGKSDPYIHVSFDGTDRNSVIGANSNFGTSIATPSLDETVDPKYNLGYVVMVDESVTRATIQVYDRGMLWDTYMGKQLITLPTVPAGQKEIVSGPNWAEMDGGGKVLYTIRVMDSNMAFLSSNLDAYSA